MTQPMEIPVKLAGTPKQEPLFHVTVKTRDGRSLPVVDPRATRALISLMDMNAVLGGAASHYGGPAALAELMSALHGFAFDEARRAKKEWHELFHLINDAGHCENGLYALKANYRMAGLDLDSLKTFRSLGSPLTGHGEAHLFPQGVLLSNGPLGSAFPQAQGLAVGDKLAGRERVTVTTISDGACMEGEAKEAFAAIPGLAAAGKMAPFVVIISDNNTKLTGRIDAECFSMEPTFRSLKDLGWKYLRLENGHDLQACYDMISQAVEEARRQPTVPVVIHAKTIKGIGTKKTAESSSGGHGFPLKSPSEMAAFLSEIYQGEAYPDVFKKWTDELLKIEADIKAKGLKDGGEKIQKGVAAAMIRARKNGLPVISVTSDLPGSTGVADFRKEFPADSVDVGVAESNMISTAAGLSKIGYIPVVDTFAQFGVTKGALPMTMASLSEAPMIAVFSHTGFQDAADGASHQALAYFSMFAAIPHVDCYALSCSEEAEALVSQAFEKFAQDRRQGRVPHSSVFFLGRENFPKNYAADVKYELGRAQVLFDSSSKHASSVCLAVGGSLVPQAMAAAKSLDEKGVGGIVVNVSALTHPDVETLGNALKKTGGRLVTAEDHQLAAGFGAWLTHQLLTSGVPVRVSSLGVRGEFGQSAYNAIDLYRQHRLDAEAMVAAASRLVKEA
ncbi:MAG: transketolase [Bdellovibrionaceae bacterium]|nr:transketolase [Pseudobdellovibrionaceae bacterium]MBX3033016.1 transketolase [Pseudobdellovibrionaceae bacterium]